MVRWLPAACLAAAVLAACLPVDPVVAFLARRFNTVRTYADDYALGLRLWAGVTALNLALAGWAAARASGWRWRSEAGADGRQAPGGSDAGFVIALALLALAVRVPGLGGSLQHDEWYFYHEYIRHGPLVFLTRTYNHPLSNLLVWLSTSVFGATEVGMRVPSLLFGVAACVGFDRLAREYWPQSDARVVSLLFALSTPAVHFAQEARGYSPGLALATWALVFHARAAAGGRARDWAAYVACAVGAVWAHLFAALLPFGLWVASMVRRPALGGAAAEGTGRGTHSVAFGAVGLLSLELYALVLPRLLGHYEGPQGAAGEPWGSLRLLLGATHAPFALQAGLAGLAAYGAWAAWRGRYAAPAALAAGVVPAIPVLWGSPYGMLARFFLFLHPLVFVCLGAGMAGAAGAIAGPDAAGGRRRNAFGGLALLVAAALGWSLVAYHAGVKIDFAAAARAVESERRPGERVGLWYDSKAVLFYVRDREAYTVVGRRAAEAARPEWVFIQDAHVGGAEGIRALLDEGYALRHEFPSRAGRTLQVWRRRD